MSPSPIPATVPDFCAELNARLDQYQQGESFPSYRELADLQAKHANIWLDALLQEYREGGGMPNYSQLRQVCDFTQALQTKMGYNGSY